LRLLKSKRTGCEILFFFRGEQHFFINSASPIFLLFKNHFKTVKRFFLNRVAFQEIFRKMSELLQEKNKKIKKVEKKKRKIFLPHGYFLATGFVGN